MMFFVYTYFCGSVYDDMVSTKMGLALFSTLWIQEFCMYRWLDAHGELYFIEVLENGAYKPIGDVTFRQGDMPIVIGDKRYRGKKIGSRVVSALIQRGKALGYGHLAVEEIYDWNEGSRRCFEKAGFRACEKTEKGARYRLDF